MMGAKAKRVKAKYKDLLAAAYEEADAWLDAVAEKQDKLVQAEARIRELEQELAEMRQTRDALQAAGTAPVTSE
jgi:predicted  nucleic acid-binding Zn-ribbon protein